MNRKQMFQHAIYNTILMFFASIVIMLTSLNATPRRQGRKKCAARLNNLLQ